MARTFGHARGSPFVIAIPIFALSSRAARVYTVYTNWRLLPFSRGPWSPRSLVHQWYLKWRRRARELHRQGRERNSRGDSPRCPSTAHHALFLSLCGFYTVFPFQLSIDSVLTSRFFNVLQGRSIRVAGSHYIRTISIFCIERGRIIIDEATFATGDAYIWMHVDIGQGSREERYEKSQVKEGGGGRKKRRSRRRRGGGRDTTGKRNLRDRRCRDTAGRAVNYKRSAKPLWSSLGGAGVSRRIDNTEFVRGRRNLDGPWFIQPPEPANQPASQPASQPG